MIGKEIVRFHCVYWPAFLMAAGLPLPKKSWRTAGCYSEESKMSKSRRQHLRTETILDVLGATRCVLPVARNRSSGWIVLLRRAGCIRYNSDLANGLAIWPAVRSP